MKRYLLILITIVIMCLTGCSEKDLAKANEALVEAKNVEESTEVEKKTTEVTTEAKITEEKKEKLADSKETKKDQKKETDKKGNTETSNKDSSKVEKSEQSKYVPTEVPTEERTERHTEEDTESQTSENTECQTEATTEVPTEAPTEAVTEAPAPASVSYSPQSVVSLATAKCQAGGMITSTDNLANQLAAGNITEAEYNDYYPYDGLGYYSVFVETDLNKASTTSGRLLGSEDAIATYIADMLLLESQPIFLIEYSGITSTGGQDFYEFRCYR